MNARRRWIDLLDVISLVAIVLAASATAFGGFRMRLGPMRLSLTSGLRITVVAALLVAIRHLLSRERPLHRRLQETLAAWWRSDALRATRPVFIASRLGVLAAGYLAVVIIGYPQRPAFRVSPNEFQNLPARWDSGWYLGIASEGYRWDPRTEHQQNIAFFPAYPMAMRMVAVLAGVRATASDANLAAYLERYHTTFLFAGVGISLATFLAALVYIYRLAREHLNLDRDAAITAVTLLSAYPFALYYSAVYTESLFLLAVLGAISAFNRNRPGVAACWGALAGLTRPNGFLLSVALGAMVAEPYVPLFGRRRSLETDAAAAKPSHHETPLAVRALVAAAPIAGMLAYSLFVYRLSGRPFAWAEVHQAAWGRAFQGVRALVTDRYQYIAEYGLYQYTASLPIDALNGLAVLLALAGVWPVTRRFGLPYAVFVLVNLLPPLLAGGLLSMGRLTSVLFPTFLWLAVAIPAGHRTAWTCAFSVLQGLGAALFFTWRPLY